MASTRSLAAPGPSEAAVVTKAALRAAGHLNVTNRVLATIIGLSEPTVSRMGAGGYELQRGQKHFELALLFVRLYRSLDAIVGRDRDVARAWLRNENAALGGRPLDLIQTIPGLVHVIAYLDARRAIV